MLIRAATPEDIPAWSEMRTALWPDTSDQHLEEIRAYFSGRSIDVAQVYVGDVDYSTVGFMELNVRNFAEGSARPKVPYVEAWYVKPEFRGRGYGKQFMRHAEQWARELGYSELASDTELGNTRSIAMHQHLGFEETERIVCFLKTWGDDEPLSDLD